MAAARMTKARAKLVLDMLVQYHGLQRKACHPHEWIALKFSCTPDAAAQMIGRGAAVIGREAWDAAVARAMAKPAADAHVVAANGEGNPKLDPTTVDLPAIESAGYDAKGEANRMITDWLERQVDHYQGQLKDLLLKDGQIRTQREQIIHSNLKAFSAAAILAAGNALDRIAEGLQQDQDEARRQAAEDARVLARDHGDVGGPFGGG